MFARYNYSRNATLSKTLSIYVNIKAVTNAILILDKTHENVNFQNINISKHKGLKINLIIAETHKNNVIVMRQIEK